MSEKLAVAPTGRRPIWDNECQANRTWLLRVRQHADGRAIYSVYATNFQNGQTAVAGSCWTPDSFPSSTTSVQRQAHQRAPFL